MRRFSELALLDSPIHPGLTVIEASAGTGKTYSISHLVPRLLLDGELPDLSSLLLVTFTKDAARELAERVRRVLLQLTSPPVPDEADRHPHVFALRRRLHDPEARQRLARALVDLDLLAVSTIHAFCQRTLQQEGSLCGLPVMPEVISDDEDFLLPLLREQWFGTLGSDPTVAALATAQGWDLETARRFVNSLRRCHHPQMEPAVGAFAHLRQRLDELCAQLHPPGPAAGFIELIQGVQSWNQGVANTADALRRLAPLREGRRETLGFWQALQFARTLPGQITARGAGRELRESVRNHPWFALADELGRVVDRLEWAWHQELGRVAIPRLARTLEARRLITQDGLIGTLHRALHRTDAAGAEQSARLADHLAGRYQVALIDESQDTDPRQFAIFRRIFLDAAQRRRLLLVGDPKQAIYGFRGADLATYLDARARAERVYTLVHTYRAPTSLVETGNALFQRAGAFHHPDMLFQPAVSALPYDRQLLRDGHPCPRLEAWVVPDGATEFSAQGRRLTQLSARVASTIVDLLRHGTLRTTHRGGGPATDQAVTPRDFAVLVSTNAQAEAMAEALRSRAVPAVINSGADVFASEEARELHLLLTAILDPRRTRRLHAALATRLLGLSAPEVAQLDQAEADGSQPGVVWRARFTGWNQKWLAQGLTALLSEWERPETAITHRLAVIPLTGERRATNYRHLTDLLLEAARTEAPRPAGVVRWLGQQITRATERSQAEERQLQLSSDREAVQVVTMHKAKGLEYPLVFCPYLADSLKKPDRVGQLPARRGGEDAATADVLVNLDLLDEESQRRRARDLAAAQLEERLRLAYVALTRAQVSAWICSFSPAPRFDQGSALDWLLRTDEELTAYPEYSDAWVSAARTDRADRHRAVLRSLGAGVLVREPPPATPDPYAPPAAPAAGAAPLAPLPPPRVPASWRITSFSTLTREQHAHGLPTADLPGPALAPVALADDPTAPAFLSAPGGAAVGTMVHDWIEGWDFSPPDPAALDRHLAGVRLPPVAPTATAWPLALAELFRTLREIRLPGAGATPLHLLCPEPHGSEWHFHLPLAGELSARDLARCFEDHAAPAHRAYASALRELPEERFHGLLQGFIDRLARCGPAWGVIDWKTNRLGPTLAAYDEAGLLRCAFAEHYLLQAHLYLVALRRYLRALGLADPPIAGAWLVFLRAIAPHQTRGVLHIAPPGPLLDALDTLFAPAHGPSA